MTSTRSRRASAQTAASRDSRWPQWAGVGVVLLGLVLAIAFIVKVAGKSLLDNYERVGYGMSRGDVEAILGKPVRVDVRKEYVQGAQIKVDILEWTLPDAPQRIRVELVNDKVVGKKLDER